MTPEELKKAGFSTICVHGSGGVDKSTGAVATPIYQSSTFAFKNAQEGAALFSGEKEGYIYTRLGNPTQDALEKEMSFLENGEAALAVASGMAATSCVILTLMGCGDTLIASDTLYGGTHQFFKESLGKIGIRVKEIDTSNPDEIEKNFDNKTKAIYLETPANPTLKLADIRKTAEIAHKNNAVLIIDNTFATPYYQRPLTLGADIVIHSATKYIGGHGDTIGGIIISTKSFIDKARGETLRDFGGCISPFNAWLLLRGLKTLPVRMDRHSHNALRLAQYLSFHPKVQQIFYPGLRIHPQYDLAAKQMSGFGGMISFILKGGKDAGITLCNSVKLMTLAVSLGDCDTLIEHPASMTHSTYSNEELEMAGIDPGLIRISVGIEGIDDLIADLSQALKRI